MKKLPPINFLTKGMEVPDTKDMIVSVFAKTTHKEDNFRIIIKSSNSQFFLAGEMAVYTVVQIMIVFPYEEEQEVYLNISPQIITEKKAQKLLEDIATNINEYLPKDE